LRKKFKLAEIVFGVTARRGIKLIGGRKRAYIASEENGGDRDLRFSLDSRESAKAELEMTVKIAEDGDAGERRRTVHGRVTHPGRHF